MHLNKSLCCWKKNIYHIDRNKFGENTRWYKNSIFKFILKQVEYAIDNVAPD